MKYLHLINEIPPLLTRWLLPHHFRSIFSGEPFGLTFHLIDTYYYVSPLRGAFYKI